MFFCNVRSRMNHRVKCPLCGRCRRRAMARRWLHWCRSTARRRCRGRRCAWAAWPPYTTVCKTSCWCATSAANVSHTTCSTWCPKTLHICAGELSCYSKWRYNDKSIWTHRYSKIFLILWFFSYFQVNAPKLSSNARWSVQLARSASCEVSQISWYR